MTTWVDHEGIMLSKFNKERQILYDLTYMWTVKQPNIKTENRLVVDRREGWEVEELDEGDQNAQTSSYKIKNF